MCILFTRLHRDVLENVFLVPSGSYTMGPPRKGVQSSRFITHKTLFDLVS